MPTEKTVFITTNPRGKGTEVSLHIESPDLKGLLSRIAKIGAGVPHDVTPTLGASPLKTLMEITEQAHALAKEFERDILFFDSTVRKQLTMKSQKAEDRPLDSVLMMFLVAEKPVTVKAMMDKYMKPRGYAVALSHIL